MLSRCFLDFSVGVRASVIGLSQISSFSLKAWQVLNVLVYITSPPFFFFFFFFFTFCPSLSSVILCSIQYITLSLIVITDLQL